jgi:hypothetical protein
MSLTLALGAVLSLMMISCNTKMSDPISLDQQNLAENRDQKCAQNECPCETPLGDISHGAVIDLFNSDEVLCGQTCESGRTPFICFNSKLYPASLPIANRDPGTDYLINRFFSCQAKECLSCLLGTTIIANGESATFYNAETMDCNQTCEGSKQVRTCTNGGLSGNPAFSFLACQERECKCRLPDDSGFLSLNGALDFYQKESVKCGESCDSNKLNRTCVSSGTGTSRTFSFNGSSSFRFQVCTQPSEASCYCNLPNYGGIVEGAAPIILFTRSFLQCGDDKELFTFEFRCGANIIYRNGQVYDPTTDPLSASTRYHTSMSNLCTGCRTPWGKSVNIGAKVIAYQVVGKSGGTCGSGCKKQERTCLETGVLDGSNEFDSETCSNLCIEEGGGAPPQACLLPWQNSYVTPGAKVPMWKRNTVACGQSCQDHFRLGTCRMETGTFDVGIEYIHKSCTELCP